MKKITVIASIFLVFAMFITSANAIVVSGCGDSERSAIQNGFRSALEQSVGVYLYAVTNVEDFRVKKDDIVAASGGSIKSYKLISKRQIGGNYFVTMNVLVDSNKMEAIIRNKVKMVTFGDVMRDYNRVSQRMIQLRQFRDMLDMLTNKTPVSQKYSLSLESYQIGESYPDKVFVTATFRLTQNPIYWDLYRKIIREISSKNPTREDGEMFLNYRRVNGKLTAEKYYVSTRMYPIEDGIDVSIVYKFPDTTSYSFTDSSEYRDNIMVKKDPNAIKTNLKRWMSGKPARDVDQLAAIGNSMIIPETGVAIKTEFTITDIEKLKQLPRLQVKCIKARDLDGNKYWEEI